MNSVSADKSIYIEMLTVRKGGFDMIAATDSLEREIARRLFTSDWNRRE